MSVHAEASNSLPSGRPKGVAAKFQEESEVASSRSMPRQEASAPLNSTGGASCSLAQARCYLCETPKQEYSLIRSFSEIVCRGCLNYEGPDRIESLIGSARRLKQSQGSPSLFELTGVFGQAHERPQRPVFQFEPLLLRGQPARQQQIVQALPRRPSFSPGPLAPFAPPPPPPQLTRRPDQPQPAGWMSPAGQTEGGDTSRCEQAKAKASSQTSAKLPPASGSLRPGEQLGGGGCCSDGQRAECQGGQSQAQCRHQQPDNPGAGPQADACRSFAPPESPLASSAPGAQSPDETARATPTGARRAPSTGQQAGTAYPPLTSLALQMMLRNAGAFADQGGLHELQPSGQSELVGGRPFAYARTQQDYSRASHTVQGFAGARQLAPTLYAPTYNQTLFSPYLPFAHSHHSLQQQQQQQQQLHPSMGPAAAYCLPPAYNQHAFAPISSHQTTATYSSIFADSRLRSLGDLRTGEQFSAAFEVQRAEGNLRHLLQSSLDEQAASKTRAACARVDQSTGKQQPEPVSRPPSAQTQPKHSLSVAQTTHKPATPAEFEPKRGANSLCQAGDLANLAAKRLESRALSRLSPRSKRKRLSEEELASLVKSSQLKYRQSSGEKCAPQLAVSPSGQVKHDFGATRRLPTVNLCEQTTNSLAESVAVKAQQLLANNKVSSATANNSDELQVEPNSSPNSAASKEFGQNGKISGEPEEQLKCLLCRERLEDRHFVQCPSVQVHKFCFSCSKASIQSQRIANGPGQAQSNMSEKGELMS